MFRSFSSQRPGAVLALLALGGLVGACSSMAQDTARQDASSETVTTIRNAGNGTSSITVTGNSAGHVEVDCSRGGSASVNSVNIDGTSLQGKTVIVTGRNTRNVTMRGDCERAKGTGNNVNVNSVTIR